MKILHIVTLSILGGAQSVVENLANKQSDNHDVYIISGGTGEAWKNLENKVHIFLIKQLQRKLSLKDFIVIIRLLYFKYKIKPDIVHLHSSKIGVLGRLVFNKNKIIYTVHGFDTIRIANKKFLFLERKLKNRASNIVGVSKYDEKNLINSRITENVSSIYNGIVDNATAFNKISYDDYIVNRMENLKKRYAFIVCCIARDDAPKKIDLFFEIARKIPNIAFIWIGNEKKYSDLSENVFLFGKVLSASIYLKFADLFILPSNYEGLPISIIEAMSFSLPIVASNVGGISELVKDDKNGYVVDNTVKEFVDKINGISSNEDIYVNMKKASRVMYEEKFTVDTMVESYEKLYKQIIMNN